MRDSISEITFNGDKRDLYESRLHEYENIHKNRRCFVVGNGPSLNKIDMQKLRNEICLGSNRVYLGYEQWGFSFPYWGIEDFLQIKQNHGEISSRLPKDTIKFIPRQFCYLFDAENVVPVNFLYSVPNFPQFSASPSRLFLGYSVSYMLLQIAVIMGCDPIYLVGMDYNYSIKKNMIEKSSANEIGVSRDLWTDPESSSHFIKNYCGADEGIKWNPPNFEKTDTAYEYAAKWAIENNRRIFNATPDSKLPYFQAVDFRKII